jgi:hypothetical protein
MFPILFRIPLPHMPLKLWWAMAAIAALSALYSGWLWTKDEKSSAKVGFGIAAAAGIAGYVWRAKAYEAVNLPIYSYGVMLGLSLVVGWYLTLGLALLWRCSVRESCMLQQILISSRRLRTWSTCAKAATSLTADFWADF